MAEIGGIGPFVFSTSEYRQCLVDGRKALFHRYIDNHRYIYKFNIHMKPKDMEECLKVHQEKGYLPDFMDIHEGTLTVALVEYEDGTMDEVNPKNLVFLDRHEYFTDYSWEAKHNEN